nr:TonB-dependent receptor [Bacteroidota bacterium]
MLVKGCIIRAVHLIFSVLACCSLIAQDPECPFSISGKVIDEHDRSPLSFAEIFLPELGIGDVADEQGRFSIVRVCSGEWIIRVMHLGCEPIEKRIKITGNTVIDFQLEHHHEQLKELEVIRERPDENVGQARSQIDAASMERVAGRDISGMLEQIAGVNMVRTGPTISKPMIHGLFGNRVLLLNQGIRQEDQQWGTEHAPNIDPFSAEQITVVKGAAAVQYGSDAIGGVVITEPVPLPRDVGTSGEIRLLGNSNGKGGGIGGSVQGGIKGFRGLGWRLQSSGRLLG